MTTPAKQIIEEMDEVLNSGIVQTSTDGTSTSFDLDFLAKRQQSLLAADPQAIAEGRARFPMMDARMRYRG